MERGQGGSRASRPSGFPRALSVTPGKIGDLQGFEQQSDMI